MKLINVATAQSGLRSQALVAKIGAPSRTKMHEETMATIELWKREIEACEHVPIVDTTRLLGLRTLVPRKYEQKLLDHNHATFSEAKRCISAQGNLLTSDVYTPPP